MTTVEQPVERQQRAARGRNRNGETWADAYERIRREHPSTVDSQIPFAGPLGASTREKIEATASGTRASDANLFRLIGDIGSIGTAPSTGARGHRPLPTDNDIAHTVQTIFRDGLGVGQGPRIEHEYTKLAFFEAFTVMLGSRTVAQMARRTGIQIERMRRIMSGKYPPTGDEMVVIARTFGKQPWYFREVRSVIIAALVLAKMDADPDQSARIVKALAP